MAAKASNEVGSFTLDLRGVSAETDRGSRFWNTSLVEMKFSVERSWIKSVRKAKNKPNYGMTNMDGLLEEVVRNKLELCGPLIDSFLKEIGKSVLSKLNRSKVTGLASPVILFVPWQVYRHVLTLARGYSGNVESSDHGVKHSIVFTKRDALLKLFSPSRFSGENFIAYRHFKKVPSKSGKKMVSVFDGRSVVAVTDKTPFTMSYSMKTERVTVTFFVQRYTKGDLPVDVSLQALMNS